MSAVEISARTILLWRRFTSKFTDNKLLHVHLRAYGLSHCENFTSAHTMLLWRAYTDSMVLRQVPQLARKDTLSISSSVCT
jgi:hypothetical protein